MRITAAVASAGIDRCEGSAMTIRWSATAALAAALAIQTTVGVAVADPEPPVETVEVSPAADAVPVVAQGSNPVSEACGRFDAAVSIAALNYEDFAYATAGDGDFVDYRDPEVWRSNVVGRTALRGAAAAALDASRTPGLPLEVSGPMRSWSLNATKLLVVMGLRRGGDSLNEAATELNAHLSEAQMACAFHAGGA